MTMILRPDLVSGKQKEIMSDFVVLVDNSKSERTRKGRYISGSSHRTGEVVKYESDSRASS